MLVCFAVVFLFSGLEAGLLSLDRIWLSEQAAKGNKRAKLLQEILRVPSRLIAVMLTMETTGAVVLAVLWTQLGDWGLEMYGLPGWTIVFWGLLLVLILVMFCDIVPKALFATNAERFTMALAPLAYALITKIVYPFARVLELTAQLIIRIFTGKWVTPKTQKVTESDLITMVTVGEDEGVLEEQEKEMIHSIFEFGDLVAREIMVPRVDMSALEIDTPVREAVELIVKTGHSRVPIYEGSSDHIKGILYAKDILRSAERVDLNTVSVSGLMRSNAFFVPETKDLSSMLEEMRARKAHLAIVIDEYGGTEGLVTIEDILEEIVGDIQDEYYKPLERLVTRNKDGSFIIDAKLGLHDFDDEVGVVLPEEDGVETVGGLLYQVLGRVPEIGESVQIEPVLHEDDEDFENGSPDVNKVILTVLEIDDNRIGRVRVNLEYAEGDETSASNGGGES